MGVRGSIQMAALGGSGCRPAHQNLSAVPVWTPDVPLAWGVLLNPTRHAGARGARPRARTVPLDRHGAKRLCKTFGPCELFGSKRFALHFVRKMQNVWTKRFASKTFGEMSNVNWPFSTKCTNKMHEAFCLCRDIECKLWPYLLTLLTSADASVPRFAGFSLIT